jgi:6-phosphogluconolactonase (cycloisomerase 2 family)
MNTTFRWSSLALLPTLLLATGCSQGVEPEEATNSAEALSGAAPAGAVFTQTNAADRNQLVAYLRHADGTLSPLGEFDTGGSGSGAGLTAQGAIARDGRWLLVVNAGSNDVSTFDLASGTPSLVGRTPSGGTNPVSVAAHDGVVYVLNAGGDNDIAGFHLDRRGALHPIGTQPLSGAGVTPTEVAFSPDGDTLVVTEKGTNAIDTYAVDRSGDAHGPTVSQSNGPAPFGFAFTPFGELVVSEAANSAASAYAVRRDGDLVSLSTSVANGQAAACWLVTSPDGRHAFTANAGSGNLSSYRVGFGGRLTLEAGDAGDDGAKSHPVDMAFSIGGAYLYSLANAAGTITVFRVAGGQLAKVASIDGLPASSTGLVAY